MPPPVSRRLRAKRACVPCHRSKRKCDAGLPCGRCRTYEYACTYDEICGAPSPVASGSSAKRELLREPESAGGGDRRGDAHGPRQPHGTRAASRRDSASKSPAPRDGVFDENKPRYVGASSVVAFPRLVGLGMGSRSPPVLHSFAYNFGIRPEEKSHLPASLLDVLSERDAIEYATAFFSALGCVVDLLDHSIFIRRCNAFFRGDPDTLAFSAVVAGVVALGSFLSAESHPREIDLVHYARTFLDDPATLRKPTVEHVVGWSLRSVYLRATTRPNNAWVASCTTMHLAEAVGLPLEENVKKLADVAGAAARGQDADRLRRIFWFSWSVHVITSYEYDRSAVRFRAVTCGPVTPVTGSYTHQVVHLAQIIPSPDSPFHLQRELGSGRDEIFERMKALERLPASHPFILLTKADLMFCFYRRMHHLKSGIPDEVVRQVIKSGQEAIDAARQVTAQGFRYWNALSGVFQYACILLAVDTPTSLAQIADALQALEMMNKAADTRLTREALATARYLLRLSVNKKKKEMSLLEAAEANLQPQNLTMESDTGDAPELNFEIDWEQLLADPYLSLLSGGET